MKQLYLQTASEDREETITLGEFFGDKNLTKDTKIRLKLEMHSGTFGSQFATAQVEIID